MILITIIIIITVIIIINNNNDDNNNSNNSNNNNNNNSSRPGNTGLMSRGDSLILWEEGFSLAFVGNPSRDGVSINLLVWRNLKPNPQLLSKNYV